MTKGTLIRLIICLSFISNCAFTQSFQLSFEQINEDHGLPGNAIRSIFQDSKGVFWFGVEGMGLCKFDGYTYTLYSNNPHDSTSIGNNFIDGIIEDLAGNIWVGTNKGIYRLNRKTGRFKPYLVKGVSNLTVSKLFIDKQKQLWAASRKGIFKYRTTKDKFELQNITPQMKAEDIEANSIAQDSSGTLWIGCYNEIISYNEKHKASRCYINIPGNKKPMIDKPILCILPDNRGNIWISTTIDIEKLAIESGTFSECKNLNQADNSRYSSLLLTNNYLWTTGLSLSIIDIRNGTPIHLTDETFKSLKNNDIRCFFKDRSGNIWLGTKDKGIFIYNPKSSTFPHWTEKGQNAEGLSDRVVTSVCEDQENQLWIGTRSGGLNRFNPKTNHFTYYQPIPGSSNSLKEKYITAVTTGKAGELWFSTTSDIERFNYKQNKISHYNISLVMALLMDHSQKLWIGSRQGLSFFDNKTNEIAQDEFFDRKYPKLQNKEVSAIIEDNDNTLWIGWMTEGLTHYNPQKQSATHYYHNDKDTLSLSDNSVRCIYQDRKGRIWVGTKLNGLNLLNQVSGKFTHFDKSDGLPSNSVYHIIEDSSGCLWMGTHNGVAKFCPETKQIETYTKEYGIQSNIFNPRAVCMCRSGELLMGGNNGFNLFNPSKIKKKIDQAPLIISSIKISDKIFDIDISKDTSYTLNYDENYLAFDFSLLNYVASNKNTYAYRMSGIDKEWVSAGNRHYVSYSELSPGTYMFEIKAANAEGIWTQSPLRVTIRISPPWWATWWTRIFAILLVVTSIYSAYYYRISLLKRREKELQLLVLHRTEELTQTNHVLLEQQTKVEEQSEELRTYADSLKEANESLILGQETIQKQTEQLKKTNSQLKQLNATKDKFFSIIAHDLRNPFHTTIGFAELIIKGIKNNNTDKIEKYADLIRVSGLQGNNLLDNLLQWSRSQTGRIAFEPRLLKLSALIKNIVLLESGTAQRKNITISSNIDPNLTLQADENMLKTVIRNLLSNAIKFTNSGGNITISAGRLANVVIEISDTGVGMPPDTIENLFKIDTTISTKGTDNEAGTGLGLILCHEFIERHGGKIMVESEIGKGSTFRIYLPS